MVDLAPLAPTAPGGAPFGAAMMRPNRTFQFENGELVVETTFAAGHLDYAPGSAWGEVVITDAPAPTGSRQGLTYGYHHFPGHYTLGCRLQWDGHSICSLMDDTDRGDLNGGRIWEMSFFQQVGETNYGGFPGVGGVESFRTCEADNVPDSQCRDRFRIAFGETSMTWHVNDHFYFEQTGIPQLPAELTDGPVYVYLASVSGNTDFEVIRYHWDRLLVNPDLSSLFQDGFETGDTAAWTSTVSQ
ncbi:MAG: hypothetical protein K0U98_09040 [Deltaproteobacteria bacterium]|nr:hypothetical protein [Deltaproteobacteria bacterium]